MPAVEAGTSYKPRCSLHWSTQPNSHPSSVLFLATPVLRQPFPPLTDAVCVCCLQVVTAALGLLTELPEFATEQLIRTLQPHMLQMAAAAVAAASATQQPAATQHEAAWTAAFAAYAAAVPSKLLAAAAEDGDATAAAAAAGGDEGQDGSDQLRQALLQVRARA